MGRKMKMLRRYTSCKMAGQELQNIYRVIDQTDNLPEFLCENCGSNLDRFYEFKITCEKTDSFFRQRLASQELSYCHDEGSIAVTSTQDIEISNVEATSAQDIEISSDSSVDLGVDCVTKTIVSGGKYACVYCGKKFKRKEDS
ncbi:hypothetical protein HA402_002835 [Bradysia odoriphaga]|nr:hypothetical protein HA402_002835 [Bradysia odoriphaga]